MNFRNEAAFYVSLGWKIFPLQPGSKIPFAGSKGVHDATDDFEIIERWHRREPNSNISVATGASDLMVVDIDCKPGKPNGFHVIERFEKQRRVLPMTAHARTRSGGLHLYFRLDRPWPTHWPKKLGPGVDLQTGNLGAVLPPSFVNIDKDGVIGAYEWMRKPLGPHLPHVPKWIYDVLKPASLPRSPRGRMDGDIGKRFGGIIRAIKNAPPGEGNNDLNKAAHLAGRLIASGVLKEDEATDRMLVAAMERGRSRREALSTIRSGVRKGIAHGKL